ncbi:sugar ABC transporter substrate-binding protein [Priestia koreensis]|uniref:sugar ABC transporter substrate-binding protein n=1 Tax=Priestia koreensis TaxID=284581 RepID=UPI00203BD41B|nr:extracellular solute-binding protein [Priestia koreensis]MCM3003293.1 extracellular solute-binding protein [Priestia koreensis]
MKKSKKYLGLIGGLALSLSLTACGPKDDGKVNSVSKEDSKNKTLLVWEDQQKSSGIKEAIAQFEKEHHVKVNVMEKPYAKQIEGLRLDGPAGTGPDVLTMPGDQIGTAVTEGLIKKLDVGDDIQSLYTDVAMDAEKVDGSVYGLPKAVETTMLYYNKDLIKEEELPKTLDEWYQYDKKVTKNGNYGFLALFDQIYYAQSVMGGYGGYIFSKDSKGTYDPTDIGINNEGAIQGAEVIQKFYKEKLFPAGIVGAQGINVLESLFTSGKAAAIISGPWNIEPFTKAGINFGVAKLPQLENGQNMSSFVGVKSYNVSTYSKEPELAQELVEFLANKENSKKRYEVTQEVPAVKELADDPVVTKSEAAQAVAQQSQLSELTPNIPEMNEVWTPTDAALQTIATGKANPKEALNQAAKTIKGQIKAKHGK